MTFEMWAIQCGNGNLLTIENRPYLFATRELASKYKYLYDSDKIIKVSVTLEGYFVSEGSVVEKK